MNKTILREPSPRFYHGSRRRFPIGFELLPQPEGFASPEQGMSHEESIMEKFRPAHCLPRAESVFMVKSPDDVDMAGAAEDFIYLVDPQGAVEQNDMDWYSRLSGILAADAASPEAERIAQAYWSGLPSDNPDSSLIEYRSRSARILRVVEDNSIAGPSDTESIQARTQTFTEHEVCLAGNDMEFGWDDTTYTLQDVPISRINAGKTPKPEDYRNGGPSNHYEDGTDDEVAYVRIIQQNLDSLPPIVLTKDDLGTVDGNHRLAAFADAGRATIRAFVASYTNTEFSERAARQRESFTAPRR